ncbi:MAG TPA: hypothetical protein VJJ79_00535 [Candidatus Nanoarchaeia archaeon]|nr:hypothetical protein [Candidatus Nanoarchaeia archaeon]
MKAIVFDSSTIISIAMNNLLWTLGPLRKQFKGEFYIPLSVKEEVIDAALRTKRFKLEGLQIQNEIVEGNLTLYTEDLIKEIHEIESIANSTFACNGNDIHIIDKGEIAALALCQKIGAEVLFIDERTTRLLIEAPNMLASILHNKMHKQVHINKENLSFIHKRMKGIHILRSVEFGVAAYELGLLDKYMPQKTQETKRQLLDAVLWGMKLRGCAVSDFEIQQIMEKEIK